MKTQLKIPFNMVEIVIALVIILVALVGILGLMPRNTATSQDAISRSSAADGADQVLRRLKMQLVADTTGTEIGNIPTAKYAGDDRQVPFTADFSNLTSKLSITYDPVASPKYRALKITQRTDVNQTDFEGIMRLWRTETAATGGKQETINAEVSWPANVEYAKRNKQVYSYDLFKAVAVVNAAAAPTPMFTVNNGVLIVNKKINVTAVSIGAAMTYSGYAMPVTCDISVNGVWKQPFGDVNKPITGGRVDGASRTYNLGLLDVGSQVVVMGKCWIHNGSSPWDTDAKWQAYGGPPTPPVLSSPASSQVWVVKNGEKPVGCAGYDGQASVTTYLAPYMNPDGTIKIGPNDIMYLFEMGSTDPSSAAFDSNDLMVLIQGTDAN